MGVFSARARGGRVCLITGASSGIGADTARRLAGEGDHVVITARREDRLDALAREIEAKGGRVTSLPLDLGAPGAGEELVSRVADEVAPIDVLVNNAGFGAQIRFEEMEMVDLERMFRVNVFSLMEACKAVIPRMKRAGGGTIVNVASVGGLVPHPLNVAYCSTKHAVVGFSRSLRLELSGTGVHVVAFCPGGTKTEFWDVALDEIGWDPVLIASQASSDAVAREVVRATRSRRDVILPNLGAKMFIWADRWLKPLSDAGNVLYRDRVLRS